MLRGIALLAVVLVFASCATILAKDRRSVVVTSNPAGASIFVNTVEIGTTPTRISVDDHNRLEIIIRKTGFHSGGCYINTSVEALWVILDVLLIYTIVPLVVDLVTGEWSSLESEFCTVELLPL